MSAVLSLRDAPVDVTGLLMNLPDCVSEVVVVGGPAADTAKLAQSKKIRVRVVEQQEPGEEARLASGYDAADGDIVVMLNDESDASGVERFVRALVNGADFSCETAAPPPARDAAAR